MESNFLEEDMEQTPNKNVYELIRVITRSLGLLIPLMTVCVGVFFIPEIRDILVGGIIGVLGTAGIFYYEGKD